MWAARQRSRCQRVPTASQGVVPSTSRFEARAGSLHVTFDVFPLAVVLPRLPTDVSVQVTPLRSASCDDSNEHVPSLRVTHPDGLLPSLHFPVTRAPSTTVS